MSVGDLITGVTSTSGVQYEWAGVLLGTGTKWLVQSMDGLDSAPDINTDDTARNDDHGAIFGTDLLASREISASLAYMGNSHAEVMAAYRTLARVMRPLRTLYPFAFQRPGEVKKQVFVRPRRRNFPSDGDVALGLAEGTLVWDAPDPRIFSLVEHTQRITLAAGATSGSVHINSAGDFSGWPRFVLAGAGSNPRIAVSSQTPDSLDGTAYNGSTIAIDGVMGAGDTMAIDAKLKTITLNGANAYNLKRNDNVWWPYMPGDQVVAITRPAGGGAQTLDIYYYDVWL